MVILVLEKREVTKILHGLSLAILQGYQRLEDSENSDEELKIINRSIDSYEELKEKIKAELKNP